MDPFKALRPNEIPKPLFQIEQRKRHTDIQVNLKRKHLKSFDSNARKQRLSIDKSQQGANMKSTPVMSYRPPTKE